MLKNRLAAHLKQGAVGFPTTLASSVGLIMASPVILTVTSGFGRGGDTFAVAILIGFIMMQAQLMSFSEAAILIPTIISPAGWGVFLLLLVRCAPIWWCMCLRGRQKPSCRA